MIEKPQYDLIAYIVPIATVSEGTTVQLDGSRSYYKIHVNLSDKDHNIITTRTVNEKEDGISYSWKQIDGPIVTLNNKNTAKPSFVAPSILVSNKNNTEPEIHSILKFQLLVTDKNGALSQPVSEEVIVKMVQRALILQGGGALGAYEVGVVRGLVEDLIKKNYDSDHKHRHGSSSNNRPLFDIIAGTSIGAVNAAILVGNVLKHQRETANLEQDEIWKDSVRVLEEFWDEIASPLTLIPKSILHNPLFESLLKNWQTLNETNASLFALWWNNAKNMMDVWTQYHDTLSKQAQQINEVIYPYGDGPYIPVFEEEWPYIKWMSWKENWKEEWPYIQYYFYLPENYGPPATAEAARRFFSYTNSLMYGVPRVLLPAIQQPDVRFFSANFTRFDNTPLARTIKKHWDYEKLPIKTSFKDLQPRLILVSVDTLDATSAVPFDSYTNENGICKTEYGDEEYKHVIEYPNGITMEHVMSSMSTHLKHKYPKMKVKEKEWHEKRGEEEELRYFWDGAYLSNTPLREVLHQHRYYWREVKKETARLENGRQEILVPDLQLYVINLYPSIETELPMDADTIQDRQVDISFSDKTNYDIKVGETFTDLIELIEQLESLAIKHSEEDDSFKKEYNALLNRTTKTKERSGLQRRTYRDLLVGSFDITNVSYIERSDDGNTIFGKAFEFSYKTVKQLEQAGYEDAQTSIEIESLKKMIQDFVNKDIVTIEQTYTLGQKLQMAQIHAKHHDIDKAIDRLNDLVRSAKFIIGEKDLEVKEKLAAFIKSTSLLQLQMMTNKLRILVNKGIITQGDNLKQRLDTLKALLKDQNRYDSEQIEHELQQFITETGNTAFAMGSGQQQHHQKQLNAAAKLLLEGNYTD